MIFCTGSEGRPEFQYFSIAWNEWYFPNVHIAFSGVGPAPSMRPYGCGAGGF
jgi:hypothetical protein